MTKTLKTTTLSAALAVAFLSAGAFAGANTSPMIANTNVTIIHKNSAWPIKGQITSNACDFKRCIEA